jgi:Endosomal/lysosomal potassium channel TMEM175
MPVSYRRIAGVSLERLAALSDGIFTVAMTLLVLGLSVQARSRSVAFSRWSSDSTGCPPGGFDRQADSLWPMWITWLRPRRKQPLCR